ncbi:uncharacterized protein [Cherax quadricarinatus]|uniref:uncharacterized protein isoform X3 n=1 Tax=Cherax quadricarinatus TaxID=27406 RepID=UPI0023795F17|nr:uncharacterized protein LOC128702288 isoform X2 [Cherax quadricarinatus]
MASSLESVNAMSPRQWNHSTRFGFQTGTQIRKTTLETPPEQLFTLPTTPTVCIYVKSIDPRGGGVALDTTAQNGLVVRMLGDVKGSTTVETSLTPSVAVPGSSDAWRSSASSVAGAAGTSGEMSVGEAEERLLRSVVRGTSSYSRFMTLHRRRRRKPPTRQLNQPHRALLDDLYHGPTQCVLSQVGVWSFNAFALDSVCGGRPVSVLCVYLLHKYGLIQHFKFDTVTIWKCFSLIEDGYHASNPYHNAIHAADVTQAMHCYLQEEKIREHMTPLEVLAALVAAVCHDLDHPGVNQPFLIATDNHLAALYKNLSVLENHHWRCAMGCLWESGLLDSWAPEDVSVLQEMIRSLILATDITRQQEFLTRFRRYLDADSFDMNDPEHRHFSLQIALKCADICNPCRPWEISRKWSHKICDEFYRQGDYERQLNLRITPQCDRYVTSIAKIQIGFIKFVVSPLFVAWDSWLNTSLSTSMVTHMNRNLVLWEEQLAREAAEVAATQLSITPLDSLRLPIEEPGEEPDDVDGGTTPSSSGDSHQSVLGSLENVSRSLQLGRRHSVPLNLPRLVPRTVIRRESLPEVGGQPLVVETVMMGGLSLTSLTSHTIDPNVTLTADALLPEPSITTMGGVSNGRSRHASKLSRRMSLPPLWSQHPRSRPLQTLQPMSPTPSEDSTSPQDTQENLPPSEDSKQRTEIVGSTAQGSVGGSGNECEDSGGCTGSNNSGDCCESTGQTHRSTRCDTMPSVRDCCVHSRKSVQNYQGATFLHSECSDNVHYRALGGKVLVRRASLDSSSISSKREFLDRLAHDGSKFARVDRLNSEVDKENKAPTREPLISRDRQVPFWKTRAWRSLNYEDENISDHREKMIKPGIYKLNPTQGSMFIHGRRGSAPLLRPEELWGGLRGGAERPDQRYLSTRRGSAPAQPIHQGHKMLKLGHAGGLLGACGGGGGIGGGGVGSIGAGKIGILPPLKRQRVFPQPLNRTNSFSILEPFIASISGSDTDSGPEVPGSPRTPLTSTENLPISDTPFGPSRLKGRRGSVPFDIPGTDVGYEFSFMKDHSERRFGRRGSGGLEMLPSLVARALPSMPTAYGGHGVCGGGSGGAGIPSSLTHHHEFHRGSGGVELFAGFWRSHLESGSSTLDDPDLCSQSSGGMTPGTPGGLPPPRVAMPHTLHRRSSLPTDLFYSGDLSVWDSEGT